MKRMLVLTAALYLAPATFAESPAAHATRMRDGTHDFDFEFGEWRVHHRVKRAATGVWVEFDGTAKVWPLLDGAGNVEDNVFDRAEGITRGVATRAYDPTSHTWAIWWIDSRNPHGALDPPVKGAFENGVGRFYSDSVINGRNIRTRFTWSQITATSARWEQAWSADAGQTWDINWVMEFRRVAALS
jgi:hypothetical protein